MSLYRTWRPRSFSDLVGQDAVVRTLSSALASGKIAHAYLFSGPRGSGKTSAAKIMARCLDCVNGPTPTPDNTCENCLAILAGTALDVLEIDAASNRGIDEIRALRDAVKFAPSSMRMKVYIIDEAHMLTKEGANAFLKTLEEPPPHAVFILATTEPEKLPVTILSRCQRYAFRRIAIPVMIERMREIAAAEKLQIDDHALAAIAYRADGGLRDALTMLEQAAAFADGAITAETIDRAFGATGRAHARELTSAALAGDASAALRVVETASDEGTDMQVLLRAMIAQFRNLLVARVDPELLARDLAPEDAEDASRRAREAEQTALIRALRIFADAAALARTSGNPRLELESALLRYILAEDHAPRNAAQAPAEKTVSALPAPTQEPADMPKPAAPKPTATAKPAPKAAVSKAPEAKVPETAGGTPTLQKVRAAWGNVRGRVEAERQSLRAPLSRTNVEAVEGNALVLRLPDTWSADSLRDHIALVEKAVADVLGARLKVICKVDGTPRAKGAEPESAPQEAEDPDALFQYADERIGRS